MVVLASELNLICRTWLLLNSLYSNMSLWRSLSKNCSKLCPSIICSGSSPFILITSAWMPSQVTLQLKLSANLFSMQSLPLGLHFFRSCGCNCIIMLFVSYHILPDLLASTTPKGHNYILQGASLSCNSRTILLRNSFPSMAS